MSLHGTVLLVDDEAYVRDSLGAVLERRGFAVRAATSAEELAGEGFLDGVDAVVSDLRMPGAGGLDLLERLATAHPGVPVIVLTAHGSIASAVECMRAGAFEYLQKPADPDRIALVLQRALGEADLRRQLNYLRTDADRILLGTSPGWKRVLELARIAAPVDTAVLLTGETGVGKEEVAKLIHRQSHRRQGAFVAVNCAAIPIELFESEFFGHRRGAFTGATADRDGRFRVAHHGTLLLDEVDSLPPAAQAKVLRVLEDGAFERLGDSRQTTVDVRLLCASNSDLDRAVAEGRFRADLFYRVNVMAIEIPPLRERQEDIPLLARAFLAEFAQRFGRRIADIEPETEAILCRYEWPGNIRELRNVIERSTLLEKSARLRPSSLPFGLVEGAAEHSPAPDLALRPSLLAHERRLLEEALARAGGVRRQAARLLGIDERNLTYYLKKHGLMAGRGAK